jgi:hypothetical protein
MDRAHEHGINLFDTADVYGWVQGEGITEQIIGRGFDQGGGRRERTVLATKPYGSMSDWPNDTYLSARNIRHACDASLRRLRTDYVDLYQMHHVDRSTPFEEVWEAMDVLRQQGKISTTSRCRRCRGGRTRRWPTCSCRRGTPRSPTTRAAGDGRCTACCSGTSGRGSTRSSSPT